MFFSWQACTTARFLPTLGQEEVAATSRGARGKSGGVTTATSLGAGHASRRTGWKRTPPRRHLAAPRVNNTKTKCFPGRRRVQLRQLLMPALTPPKMQSVPRLAVGRETTLRPVKKTTEMKFTTTTIEERNNYPKTRMEQM